MSQKGAKQIPHRDVRRHLPGASLQVEAAGGDQRYGTPSNAGTDGMAGHLSSHPQCQGTPRAALPHPSPLLSVSDSTAHYKCPPRGISSVPCNRSRFSDLEPKAPRSVGAGVGGSRVAARSPPLRFQACLQALFSLNLPKFSYGTTASILSRVR